MQRHVAAELGINRGAKKKEKAVVVDRVRLDAGAVLILFRPGNLFMYFAPGARGGS